MTATDHVEQLKQWIARTKRDLHIAKRDLKAFKSTLSASGYALKGSDQYDHALYVKANDLTGRKLDLERTLKSQQQQLRQAQKGAKKGKTPKQLDAEIDAFLKQ